MVHLVDGQWVHEDKIFDPKKSKAEFIREKSQFRNLAAALIRFNSVYYGHFKCNLQPLSDYPNLSHYIKQLYHLPGIAKTVNFKHIKQNYYYSQFTINPTHILPKGPLLDLSLPQ